MPQPDTGRIADAVKHITSCLKMDPERLKALFAFTPRTKDDPETIALALQRILEKYFRVALPLANSKQLKAGQSTQFIDESIAALPPRTITVAVQPNQWVLAIQGKPAIDGKDGYAELFYNWKREAGVVDDHGYIDLKRTNALSGVNRGDHLATIHLHTEGESGITADGKGIKQRAGHPYKIKWDENSLIKTDVPGESNQFMLTAERAGIVHATFLKPRDPSTLASIGIQETVTINGDVDYAIGDQGTIDGRGPECNFNLNIKGNIRGAFSLQSNGFIHVSGEIEGKKVEADEIRANMISGSCHARAKNTLTVNSIVNASAHARLLTITHNASGSTLVADEKITFENGANCVGLNLSAQEVFFFDTHISGQSIITLGNDLFEQHKTLKKQLKSQEREAHKLSQPNKEIALSLLTDIARIEAIAHKNRTGAQPTVFEMIHQLKAGITATVQKAGQKIKEQTINLCYLLQSAMADSHFHESILVKVESLSKHMKRYNQSAETLSPVMDLLEEQTNHFNEVNKRIRQGLIIHMTNPTFIGKTAELRVRCGCVEKIFTVDMFGSGNFEIQYIIPFEEEDVTKGQVYVSDV